MKLQFITKQGYIQGSPFVHFPPLFGWTVQNGRNGKKWKKWTKWTVSHDSVT